jgi:glycosyltransferase involved in cell wall biosynthesis
VDDILAAKPASDLRIVWVSFAYGFGTDLAYFGPLFAEFKRRMPGTQVPVERNYPVDNYPGLPLLPALRFWYKHVKREAGAGVYEGDLPMPRASVLFALAKIPADVYVLIEFSAVSMLGLLVAKIKRKKVVLLIESHPRYRGSTPGGTRSEQVKGWLARRADAILAGNEAAREFALEHLGVSADRLVIGPYLTSQPQPTATRTPAFPADCRVKFLFLNSLNPRKGIEQLVRAFGRLDDDELARCVLDVVGTGPQLQEVVALVSELGLDNSVRFHGKVPYHDIGAAYAACDIVVCPTLADYRSLAGIEAVNAGKPVLISVYDGARDELVAATSSAVEIDPVDVERLTEQLRALIVDDRRREALVSHARNSIPEQFSITAAVDNVQRAVEMATRAEVSERMLEKGVAR